MLRDPSVSWLPNLTSSPCACWMRTRDQSASISSATIIGRLVRTPVPISARCATIVTMPSGAIATNTRGSTTVPCGILSAPVWYAAKAGRDITGAASTNPPASPRPFRMLRRETLSTLMYRSKPRSFLGLVRMFMITPPSKRDGLRFRCVGNSHSGRYYPTSLRVSDRGWVLDFRSARLRPA